MQRESPEIRVPERAQTGQVVHLPLETAGRDRARLERGKARQVAAQERQPLLGAPDRTMAVEQALRDEREIGRVLLLDPFPGLDGAVVIARKRED